MRKVWYCQIWIQTYLGFIVLILTYIQLALLKSNLTMVVEFSFCRFIHDLLNLFQYFCIEERNGDLTKSIERQTNMTSKQNKMFMKLFSCFKFFGYSKAFKDLHFDVKRLGNFDCTNWKFHNLINVTEESN